MAIARRYPGCRGLEWERHNKGRDIWTDDGIVAVGLQRQFHLDGPSVDRYFPWGSPGDTPVVGDWNGTGSTKVGAFGPRTGLWLLGCVPVGISISPIEVRDGKFRLPAAPAPRLRRRDGGNHCRDEPSAWESVPYSNFGSSSVANPSSSSSLSSRSRIVVCNADLGMACIWKTPLDVLRSANAEKVLAAARMYGEHGDA